MSADTYRMARVISGFTAESLIGADARKRLAHLSAILEESSDMIATTDLNGTIMYANGACRHRFDLESLDGIAIGGRSLFDFFTEKSRNEFVRDAIPALWQTGRWHGEVEALNPDGSVTPISQTAIAHLDSNGRPAFFSGVARDISAARTAEAQLRASEEWFRALIAQSNDVILVLTAEGRISYVSPAMERIFGFPDGELLGQDAFDLVHPDDTERVLARFRDTAMGRGATDGTQYRIRHADGTWRWVESFTTNHLHTPYIAGLVINARDITARYNTTVALAEAAALLASVMGAATSQALFITDRNANIVAFSTGAEQLLGYRADEVLGRLHPKVFHNVAEVTEAAAQLGLEPDDLFVHQPPDGRPIVREWQFIRNDGTTFDGKLTVSARSDENGELAGFFYVASDITNRRRREAELLSQAEHDTLTGLPNRKYLYRVLGEASAEQSWHHPGRALLFIDLDHFKAVNDNHGHRTGDELLVAVAGRLQGTMRSGDLIARVGGDEFVILLAAQRSVADAQHVAERIVIEIAKPFAIGMCQLTIGASVGVTRSKASQQHHDVIAVADAAAYEAKHSGRGRTCKRL